MNTYNPLRNRIWADISDGVDILEEAATLNNIAARKIERPTGKVLLVGDALCFPVIIRRDFHYGNKSVLLMHGYKTVALTRDAEGKRTLGKMLYEGIDPEFSVKYAVASRP